MGIRADDDLAGGGQALFRQQGVLNAHLSHVIKMGDGVPLRKLPAGGAQLGGLDILTGGGVIQHNGDPVPVKHSGQPRLFEFRDGHRGGDVVAQHQIQLSLHELARFHLGKPRGAGQNLLGHGHAHKKSS